MATKKTRFNRLRLIQRALDDSLSVSDFTARVYPSEFKNQIKVCLKPTYGKRKSYCDHLYASDLVSQIRHGGFITSQDLAEMFKRAGSGSLKRYPWE